MGLFTRALAALAAVVLLVAGCGGDDTDVADDTESTDDTDVADDTDTADDTDVADDTDTGDDAEPPPESTDPPPESTEPAPEPEPALSQADGVWTIDWDGLASTPFYAPAAEGAADPFFHIHTDPATDGFFFALEMYTTGYGALWTGETGTVDISCNEAAPGPGSTGICPKFDPDGPGPIGEIAGFDATGSITIDRLDADGYDITVHSVTLTDGTTIGEFTLTG